MLERSIDYIDPDEAGTLAGLFRARVARGGVRTAYHQYDRATKRWTAFSWTDMAREAARWQSLLAGEGLASGDRVALQAKNGVDWVAFEQAALGMGLVVVPLFVDDRPENVAYIVEDAGIRLLLVQDAERLRRLAPALRPVTCLERVVVLEGQADGDRRAVAAADRLPQTGGPLLTADAPPEALATLVYTSGTTGNPKGVMLSHRNVLHNAYASLSLESFYADDLFLSFLPLSHMLERTAGYYVPMMAGATVAYARSVQHLADDLASIRPTVLVSVPRVFERVFERIHQDAARRGASARFLLRAAVARGWRRFERRQQGRKAEFGFGGRLLDRLVGAKVRARLGGRLRFAVSGGAALPYEVARLFIAMGIEVLQGYGLTEASPVISVNTPADNDPASVGKPLPGLESRVDQRGELAVRGPSVMLGYWNNPRATAALLDPDGWLHTGDQVRIVDERIYITGRLKEILVLSNGEKVPPAELESAITLDPLFEHALVLGEGRPYLGALLAINVERWPEFAASAGIDPEEEGALGSPAVRHALGERVRSRLRAFPGYARIRRVVPTLDEWSVDNGLLTPTLKLRRKEVQRRYEKLIGGLFGER